jgi:hypothetical protein
MLEIKFLRLGLLISAARSPKCLFSEARFAHICGQVSKMFKIKLPMLVFAHIWSHVFKTLLKLVKLVLLISAARSPKMVEIKLLRLVLLISAAMFSKYWKSSF